MFCSQTFAISSFLNNLKFNIYKPINKIKNRFVEKNDDSNSFPDDAGNIPRPLIPFLPFRIKNLGFAQII